MDYEERIIVEVVMFCEEASCEDFVKIFGERIGTHLWLMFREREGLETWYANLDLENRKLFVDEIKKRTWERKKRQDRDLRKWSSVGEF